MGYVPCGDGTLTVISFKNAPARVAVVAVTQAGARTGAVDPATGLVYLPTAVLGPPESAGGRSSIVPDTLKVLVDRDIVAAVDEDSFQSRQRCPLRVRVRRRPAAVQGPRSSAPSCFPGT